MTRIPALDGIRAFAVLLVVVFHVSRETLSGGFIGVDIFFVLSGFLITSILADEWRRTRAIDYRSFLLRRLKRLYPALIVLLAIFSLIGPFIFSDLHPLAELLFSGSYISNYSYIFSAQPKYLQHTWSLSVEMQFYLIWPFFIAFIAGKQRLIALLVLGTLYAASTFLRISFHDADLYQRSYYAFDTRASGLILGAVIAFLPAFSFGRLSGFLVTASIAILIVLAAVLNFYDDIAASLGTVTAELATGLAILGLRDGKGLLQRFLASPVPVALGKWSYGIYLYHYPISRYLRTDTDPLINGALTLGLSIAMAALSYKLVESRFYHRRSGAVPVREKI